LGDYAGSVADLTEAIRLNPHDDPECYCNRGITYERQGQSKEAIADFTKAIGLRADYAKAYFHRYVLRERLGDYAGAAADSNQVRRINPGAFTAKAKP